MKQLLMIAGVALALAGCLYNDLRPNYKPPYRLGMNVEEVKNGYGMPSAQRGKDSDKEVVLYYKFWRYGTDCLVFVGWPCLGIEKHTIWMLFKDGALVKVNDNYVKPEYESSSATWIR